MYKKIFNILLYYILLKSYNTIRGELCMLTKMLEESGAFENLPIPDQQIMYRLANIFQSNTKYLFMSPEELLSSTALGTKDYWTSLLNYQETQGYIKAQMAFLSQISQRKTFQSLVQMALEGSQQAAKQVQELSGIMNQQDTNRVVVLHYIPRGIN